MQLLAAHQVLIASAIALSALFGLRALALFSRGGGAANLAIAAGSAVVLAALVVYFRKVRARYLEAKAAAPRRGR
jgi:hypothetical protein